MHADNGELSVLGIDVSLDPQAVQNKISYMPQRFGLYDDLSVQENLDLYADLHGVTKAERKERYESLLNMTNLGPFTQRLAGKLSGGMKQKLGLACTLVRLPDLLLLDEPTVGVDPLSRRELWEIIDNLISTEQLTVLLSTTYLDEVAHCKQVYVFDEGKIIAQGSAAEISAPADGLCFIAAPGPNQSTRQLQSELLNKSDLIIDATPQAGEVRYIKDAKASDATLKSVLKDAKVRPVKAQVEDGFMVIMRQRKNEVFVPLKSYELTDEVRQQSNKPIIEVKDLVRTFGDFTAVDKTSFSVYRGEIFGLLGPNGAGKTTTFRMLCGLLPPTSGFLQVAGVNLRNAPAQARRKIGYVSQKFSLYSNITVLENLEFFAGVYGLDNKIKSTRITEVLKEFDLERQKNQTSGQLAGGFKQRLAMAVGLVHQPEILFLDEPTSGADPLARRAFWQRINALAAAGITIIITTHFMEEAEYCDRIVIQDAGKVLALGTPQEVRAQAGQDPHSTMENVFINIVENARKNQRQSVEAAL